MFDVFTPVKGLMKLETICIDNNGVVPQIISPISNSESTIFLNEYIFIMISFPTGKLRKKVFILYLQEISFLFQLHKLEKKMLKIFVKQIRGNMTINSILAKLKIDSFAFLSRS